jgi:glycosyltransferase involved in cell wall biosynthesis
LKIAFVYDMVYPYSTGGAERRYHFLASALAKRHEVHWVGLKLWKGPSKIVTEEGVTLHGVIRPPGKFYNEEGYRTLLEPPWFGAALFQWPGLRGMDVIDCSSFPYFNVFSARAITAFSKAKVAVTWHEHWGGYWKQYAGKAALMGRMVEKMAVKMTPHAISVSDHTRQKLIKAGMKPERVTVVPNGLSLSSIGNATPLPGGPDILFAGRLIREKRVHLLLQAMAKPPLSETSATCWVVGKGSDSEYLKRMAGDLGLGERVKFFDWLKEEDLYGAMRSAAAFALLSEREGFGMVVLESMACGTPVVVATGVNSAAPDLVTDGSDGFVVQPEPEAVSRALAELVRGWASPGCARRRATAGTM